MSVTRAAFIALLVYVTSFVLQSSGGGALAPGPRTVVILHESAEKTPELAALFVALRQDDYFPAQHHKLLILDDDAVLADGKPVPLVAKLNGLSAPPPAAYVLAGEEVLAHETLDADPTTEEVLAIVKGAGG